MVTAPYVLNSSPVRAQSLTTAGLPAGGPGTLQAPSEVSKPSVSAAGAADDERRVVGEDAAAAGAGVGDVAERDLDLLAA